MIVLKDRNVNGLYAQAIHRMYKEEGGRNFWFEDYPSRNGPMREFIQPVVSVYEKPRERVLFDAVRDCNPFLHFFEALWMLAGRNDLAFLTQFTRNMANFSDDGKTLNGAYGHRWRHHFKEHHHEQGFSMADPGRDYTTDFDQIADAIYELSTDPMSRRVVTQMWNGNEDKSSKDIPCNTSVMWRLRGGVLDMTVTNRSNDIVWGCYGANAVHFSMLHEYVAGSVGVRVGSYYQVSNSLHLYPELPIVKRLYDSPLPALVNDCPYAEYEVSAYPMFWGGVNQLEFDIDLRNFFKEEMEQWETPFFAEVVAPMWRAFKHYKGKRPSKAVTEADNIMATDWQKAVREWLHRRMNK